MKKILKTLLITSLALFGSLSYASNINQFPPGFRLIDGSHLNEIVDAVNTITGGTAAPAVSGIVAGYKLARGETALDGTNPTPVTTGLTTIVACNLTIKTTVAPGVSTSTLTYNTSAGTLNMYGWMPTSSSVTTLIASTYTPTVGWICVGT